ncbi:MAG TPA: hypothetical protein VGM23_00615 [Armatimonadota bacterium]
MIDRNSARLLKQHGMSFHWNDHARKWWLQKETKDGKSKRTHPTLAASREEAEVAATQFIQKVLGEPDSSLS